jgi:hypothetical protein
MTTEVKKDVVLMRGIGVSSGIVIGKANLIDTGRFETSKYYHLDSVGAGLRHPSTITSTVSVQR